MRRALEIFFKPNSQYAAAPTAAVSGVVGIAMFAGSPFGQTIVQFSFESSAERLVVGSSTAVGVATAAPKAANHGPPETDPDAPTATDLAWEKISYAGFEALDPGELERSGGEEGGGHHDGDDGDDEGRHEPSAAGSRTGRRRGHPGGSRGGRRGRLFDPAHGEYTSESA